jgi:hypothetical protein
MRLVIDRPGQQEHPGAAQAVIEHLQHRAAERGPRVLAVLLAQFGRISVVDLLIEFGTGVLGDVDARDPGHDLSLAVLFRPHRAIRQGGDGQP